MFKTIEEQPIKFFACHGCLQHIFPQGLKIWFSKNNQKYQNIFKGTQTLDKDPKLASVPVTTPL